LTQGPKSQVRLYCLLARSSPLAVIFRRGPTRQVQLLLWNTDTDEFQEGQWFKGRIYERRCDLSPSGERLLYFAANQKKPFFSWTAVSRPPFLTAIALWPKGDAWGGGGLFAGENAIQLNHRELEMGLAPGFNLPRNVLVEPLGPGSGWGEDSPVMDMRLERDGWTRSVNGKLIPRGVRSTLSFEMNPPLIWAKRNPKPGRKFELQMLIKGFGQKNGPWYSLDYVLIRERSVITTLPAADWSDWDRNGDLLYASEGRIYRNRGGDFDSSAPKQLIDLTGSKFTNMESPIEAKQWNGKLRQQRLR